MWAPISDGYLTPLEGCTTEPCQVSLGFQVSFLCPIIVCLLPAWTSLAGLASHIWLVLLQSFHLTAMDKRRGWRWDPVKIFWWWKDEHTVGKNRWLVCRQNKVTPVLLLDPKPSGGLGAMMERGGETFIQKCMCTGSVLISVWLNTCRPNISIYSGVS